MDDRNVTAAEMLEHLTALECSLQRRYIDIGKEILELAEKENKEINQMVEEIVIIRRSLSQIKCQGCSGANCADSKFCRHCGVSLTTKNTKENDHE